MKLRAACVALLLGLCVSSAHAEPSLSVAGTEFVLNADGASYRGGDVVGATLHIRVDGKVLDLRIAAVEKDGEVHSGGLFLYRFVTTNEAGEEIELCSPDAKGRSLGFPVSDGRGGFELACTGSAIDKCLRWGYRPWDETPKGPPLRALHAACVHMVRADYGGDGRPTTREGTVVYVCDRFGVVPCAKKPPLTFEAAWGVTGATCVARPRIPRNASLARLRKQYPKLDGHLGSKACDPRTAFRDSRALLINRSVAR